MKSEKEILADGSIVIGLREDKVEPKAEVKEPAEKPKRTTKKK